MISLESPRGTGERFRKKLPSGVSILRTSLVTSLISSCQSFSAILSLYVPYGFPMLYGGDVTTSRTEPSGTVLKSSRQSPIL